MSKLDQSEPFRKNATRWGDMFAPQTRTGRHPSAGYRTDAEVR